MSCILTLHMPCPNRDQTANQRGQFVMHMVSRRLGLHPPPDLSVVSFIGVECSNPVYRVHDESLQAQVPLGLVVFRQVLGHRNRIQATVYQNKSQDA